MAELIQADLAWQYSMNIRPIEGRYQETSLMDRTHDMTLSGWSTDSNDPDSFSAHYLVVAISSQTNLSHWCSPAFDNVLQQALYSQQLASYRLSPSTRYFSARATGFYH